MEVSFSEVSNDRIDDFAYLMESFPQYAARAIASAMKSEGYRLRGIMQEAHKGYGPSGANWSALNPHTGFLKWARGKAYETIEKKTTKTVWRGKKGSKKRVRVRKSRVVSNAVNPLYAWYKWVLYKYESESQKLSVGFLSRSAAGEGIFTEQAGGARIQVTEKMRGYLAARGFALKKSTHTLMLPKRPTVHPVMEAEHDQILKNIRQKYVNNVVRYIAEGNKNVS